MSCTLQEIGAVVKLADVFYLFIFYCLFLCFFRRGATLSNRAGLFEMSMPDDDQHTLKLCKVKSSDVGPLSFTASNPHGADSCLLTLEMAGRQSTTQSLLILVTFLPFSCKKFFLKIL